MGGRAAVRPIQDATPTVHAQPVGSALARQAGLAPQTRTLSRLLSLGLLLVALVALGAPMSASAERPHIGPAGSPPVSRDQSNSLPPGYDPKVAKDCQEKAVADIQFPGWNLIGRSRRRIAWSYETRDMPPICTRKYGTFLATLIPIGYKQTDIMERHPRKLGAPILVTAKHPLKMHTTYRDIKETLRKDVPTNVNLFTKMIVKWTPVRGQPSTSTSQWAN